MDYTSPWAEFELKTLVVIDTDFTTSYKSLDWKPLVHKEKYV
jgi:hypothetical protein